MRTNLQITLALLVVAALVVPCRGQRGVPAPRPAPAPVHPVGPQVVHKGGGGVAVDPWVAVACIVGALAVIGGSVFAVRAWATRTVGHVRITKTPPGEAPEEVRRAWVGVELPLRRGETEPRPVRNVGVLSGQGEAVMSGFVVDGRKAVQCLDSLAPDAAAWWRTNAPYVLASGYRLLFPAEVCERVE